MLKLQMNEVIAMHQVLSNISVIDLLTNAQNGFDTNDETDKAELCYNAIKDFLK